MCIVRCTCCCETPNCANGPASRISVALQGVPRWPGAATDAELLQLAQLRVDQFTAVWVDKEPRKSVAALERIVGREAAAQLGTLPLQKAAGATRLPASILARVEAANQLDMQIYEYARSKLHLAKRL